MGKRGPKPQFIDVACPNEQCSLYGLKGCDKVNDNLMNNLEVTKIEMDELWIIIKKNSSANGKL